MIIGIDPGHGGSNVGCSGGGLHEEELTLRTAMAVRQTMLQRDPMVRVILSREVDEYVSLVDRARRLQAADFVLVIHYDSAAKPTEGTIGTYCFDDDLIAQAAANVVEACAPEPIRPKKPGWVPVDPETWTVRCYNVLTHHRPRPALLVEVAFLSNPHHVAYLNGPDAMSEIATMLCNGAAEGLVRVAERAAGGVSV